MTREPVRPEVWMLVQDKSGIQYKYFDNEKAARKSAALRPSYWYPPRPMVQGGTLWVLRPGERWTLVDDIEGDYNVNQRRLYDNTGKAW